MWVSVGAEGEEQVGSKQGRLGGRERQEALTAREGPKAAGKGGRRGG